MSDTATPDTPAKAETSTEATTYVVLQKDDGDGWIVWTHPFAARNAEAAIRYAVATLSQNGGPGQEGTFVAIPARSWKPVRVTARVETTLELKPAS